MSYDLEFDCGPLPDRHGITGGTFELGGTREPWLNITYNYAPFFTRYGLKTAFDPYTVRLRLKSSRNWMRKFQR